jgi:aspartyl-tRNA(Asn)/glutamyl-tRNA(Gln) amidotransferase subunit A
MTINPFSSLTELSNEIAARQYNAKELSTLYLKRIQRGNSKLHAFIDVCEESVMQQACASDLRRASGHCLGPLDGLPIAIKDICDIEGQLSRCGSEVWATRRGIVTSTVVKRLRAAGMVILGKTHMVEFAFGGWGTNPTQGTPFNPWDLKHHRAPGGSSSGSGVAVAAGLAPAAIGTDTGGSVRIPASLVGITALKTTPGLISLYGVNPLSMTLDTVGSMTRSVADSALITQALAGADIHDVATVNVPIADYRKSLSKNSSLKGVRVVVLSEDQFPLTVEPAISVAFRQSVDILRSLGATILERKFPFDFADLMRRNGQIISAEAWQILGRIVNDSDAPVNDAVRSRVKSGANVSAKDYIEALKHHRNACKAWQEWMFDADVLLTPTLPIVARRLDEIDEYEMTLSTFTRGVNYLGACALTLPAGLSEIGLPIGVQLVAKHFDEATLIHVGCAFQQVTDWHRQTPDLSNLFN